MEQTWDRYQVSSFSTHCTNVMTSPVSCLHFIEEDCSPDSDPQASCGFETMKSSVNNVGRPCNEYLNSEETTKTSAASVSSTGFADVCRTPVGKGFRPVSDFHCPDAPIKNRAMKRRKPSENLKRLLAPLNFESTVKCSHIAVQ